MTYPQATAEQGKPSAMVVVEHTVLAIKSAPKEKRPLSYSRHNLICREVEAEAGRLGAAGASNVDCKDARADAGQLLACEGTEK